LLVSSPDAIANTSAKIFSPHSCSEYSPSRMPPQLISTSSFIRSYKGVLLDSLAQGTGLQPNAEPRPVVKQITCAPEATCPVADTGSKPGLSINTRPRSVISSA